MKNIKSYNTFLIREANTPCPLCSSTPDWSRADLGKQKGGGWIYKCDCTESEVGLSSSQTKKDWEGKIKTKQDNEAS